MDAKLDGVSTSEIITRILKDYNDVIRNLACGYSRKALGVSYVNEKQLWVNMGIAKFRENVKEHQETVGKKICEDEDTYYWWWIWNLFRLRPFPCLCFYIRTSHAEARR